MKPISILALSALAAPMAHAHAAAEPHIHILGNVLFAAILIGGCAWIGMRSPRRQRARIRKKDQRK